MKQELLSAKELGERLSVSPLTVARWGREGLIPQVKLSRKTIRYDFESVIEALQKASQEVQEND
ncbi:hypothetical protein ACFL6F_01050 [Planctomycetota bacterium]